MGFHCHADLNRKQVRDSRRSVGQNIFQTTRELLRFSQPKLQRHALARFEAALSGRARKTARNRAPGKRFLAPMFRLCGP
jgi:hypothetical protein